MDEEAIPILRATDAAAAVAWYGRLGFTKEWEHRFEPDLPAFMSVTRGPMRLFLSEHHGDARPDTLIYLRVGDVDAIAAEFAVPVEEAPWARWKTLTATGCGSAHRPAEPPGRLADGRVKGAEGRYQGAA
jgi:Glyoxalase superfamily protein